MFDVITIMSGKKVFEIYPDGCVYFIDGYNKDDDIPQWVFELRDKIIIKKDMGV